MRTIRDSMFRVAVLATLLLAAGGCATPAAKVDRFGAFSQAGVAFAEAIPPVLEDSLRSAVATDSLVLLEARDALETGDRIAAIEESNNDLGERVEILSDLRRHARLLRAYFVTLGDLAATDAQASGLTEVAGGFVAELGRLRPEIAGASVAGRPVSDMVAPAAEFGVAGFQSAALEQELRRNAATIERELRLLEAAIAALADAMRAEVETRTAARYRDQVVLPFVRDGRVPSDWAERRLDALQQRWQLESVDAAESAARSLRISFVALVEGGLGDSLFNALLSDIGELVGAVDHARQDGQANTGERS